jgi:hypothetical protein
VRRLKQSANCLRTNLPKLVVAKSGRILNITENPRTALAFTPVPASVAASANKETETYRKAVFRIRNQVYGSKDPDPAPFISGFQDAIKIKFLLLFRCYIYISLQR